MYWSSMKVIRSSQGHRREMSSYHPRLIYESMIATVVTASPFHSFRAWRYLTARRRLAPTVTVCGVRTLQIVDPPAGCADFTHFRSADIAYNDSVSVYRVCGWSAFNWKAIIVLGDMTLLHCHNIHSQSTTFCSSICHVSLQTVLARINFTYLPLLSDFTSLI